MKKFENLGRSLSKDEQRRIKGGDEELGNPDVRTGYCVGSTGCWLYGSPVYYSTCQADIAIYCGSGHGSCITTSGCPN